ncbi:hypothetical protein BJV78DRAFT_1188213 [Lactifluus subvellereus]|nr:hypothetical protein BJV78DRAFT_1188213 [Lactifluus subvellereus]
MDGGGTGRLIKRWGWGVAPPLTGTVTRNRPVAEAPSSIHVTPQGRLCDGTPWQRAAATVAAGLCQPIAAEGPR